MKITLMLMAAASLWGQQEGRIAGPTSGFVFDRATHSLRPVLGVPGAATIGAPLQSGVDFAAAWVSPKLDFAIARAADGSLRLFRVDGGSVVERALEGAAGAPESVAFSPSGSAALLTTAAGAFVVTGLPDAPRVAGKVDVPDSSRRPTPVVRNVRPALARVSVAVSDDGAYVLVSAGGPVRIVTTTGENRILADASNAVVAFAPRSHDAAVADSAVGVTLYRNLDGAPSPRILAKPDDAGAPGGVAFSLDGKRVFVATAAAHAVAAYDLASGSRSVIECECSPAGLVRMGDVLRLNELGGEPLWVLDAERSDARIVFVPALAAN